MCSTTTANAHRLGMVSCAHCPECLLAQRRAIRRLAGAALVALTAISSCGGESQEQGDKAQGPPQASPNPCALLQPGQVESVVGNAVAPEQVFSEGGGSLAGAKICQYKPAPQRAAASSPPGTLPTGVVVEVASAYPREVLVKYTRPNDAAGRLRAVPALGAEAVYSETLNRIVALKGSSVIAVSLRGDPSAQGYRDKAVTLASEALKRL